MEHIFGPEFDNKTKQILEMLNTAKEGAESLLEVERNDRWSEFDQLIDALRELIGGIYYMCNEYSSVYSEILLPLRCKCIMGSINTIMKSREKNRKKTLMKTEFELIPVLKIAYKDFYYQAYVYTYPDREKLFIEKEAFELAENKYISESKRIGKYNYEVSIFVQAYNHLKYTMKCVNSILQTVPKDLNYELILWDNGSTDETADYFESISPTKFIQSYVNHGAGNIKDLVIEGRYYLGVTNDVIVADNVINNLLLTMKEDDSIIKAVPATSNISNIQNVVSVRNHYNDLHEFEKFAKKNNIYDKFRHEERTRLMDPLAIVDNEKYFTNTCYGQILSANYNIAFPDDFQSYVFRRAGYKQVLCNDAYCHHFGSVTIKDEITKNNEKEVYSKGRKHFENKYGIDPWGIGFCYDLSFVEKQVEDNSGHVDILGINCGMGSNSLRIKEQMKEYVHNIDCTLYNLTDDKSFFEDLAGISYETVLVENNEDIEEYLLNKFYDYIVIDNLFVRDNINFERAVGHIIEHLSKKGKLFYCVRYAEYDTITFVLNKLTDVKKLSGGWISGKIK